MAYPKSYEPIEEQMYQILTRYSNEPFEHCDYAKDKQERDFLLNEYSLAYGNMYSFRVIPLPKKYHPKKVESK